MTMQPCDCIITSNLINIIMFVVVRDINNININRKSVTEGEVARVKLV